MNKYERTIVGMCGTAVEVDVYRVLDAWAVENPQLQHLTKKALQAGQRGHKDLREDLNDIKLSIESAILMIEQKSQLSDVEEHF